MHPTRTRGPRAARLAAVLALAALAASCTPAPPRGEWAAVRELTPAALANVQAYDANVAAGPGGRVALTWVTRDSVGASVWVAVSADSGTHFDEPRRLDLPAGHVSSYPESRPVAAFGPAGQLVVAWAERREGGPMADDLVSRTSADGGRSFEPPAWINDDHGDSLSPYHGFLALEFAPDGRALAAWIDGREMHMAPGEEEPLRAAVRIAASLDEAHSWQPSTVVARDVCPCCRIALRADPAGRVAIAYRGATGDLRDPRLAVSADGGATFALDTLVWRDAWKLPGCPSVGPGLTFNRGGGGHYLWFTGAEHESLDVSPGVYLVPWRVGAGTAGPRRALRDSLHSATRPMLAALGGATIAGVIARTRADSTHRVLALRAVRPDGALSPWQFLGTGVRSAALAGAGAGHAYAAWIEEPGDESRVRLVRLTPR